MKRISIITNGPGIAEVKSLYGQASDWVQNVLSDYDVEVKVVKAYEMEDFSSKRDDAWIITGSAHSVYDDFEWINYLKMKLGEMSKVAKPVLGICFGHQLIADTFGGKVELNPKGWEIGAYSICLTEAGIYSPLFKNIKNQAIVYESHKDCVTYLPENAVQLAYNNKCIQSFQLNSTLFAVQFHPEFSLDVLKKYVSVCKSSGIIVDDLHLPESTQSHLVLNNFINLI